MDKETKRLGKLLLESGLITEDQLEYVLEIQKSTDKKIGEIFIEEGLVTEDKIIEVLEFQFGIPHINLNKYFIDPEIPRLISEKMARRYALIPVRKDGERLIVAMTDPLNIFAIDDVKIATGLEVVPVLATNQGISTAIDQYYETESVERALAEFKQNYQVDSSSISSEFST